MTEPREARVQRRRFAPIWLVPIAAVAIAGWLGIKTLNQRGPLITITFASAEGIEAGRTRIMLRNVEVGMVEVLELSRDLSHVEVHGRMRNDLKDHLTSGVRFWVVRPRLGAGGVSGLGTLFSGVYIEMEPGQGRPTEVFKGLEEPPVLPPAGEGKTFVLRAKNLGSLSRGSPVYYRGVPVGETLGATLAPDGRSVAVSIFVRAPHDPLVHPESRFWNASGIEVSTGGAGFKARAESLQTVILGGIAFDTRSESEDGPQSPKDTEFELYPDKDSAQSAPYGPQVSYLVHFSGSVRGVDVGTPVELLGIPVGRVTDVRLEGEGGRIRVPVTMTLEPERVLLHQSELPTEERALQQSTDAQMALLVARGLRAELQTASLLTGNKVVALAFHPRAARARLVFGGPCPEIPTVPGSGFDDLAESATGLLADARTLVQGANEVLRSPEIASTLKNLNVMTHEASTHIGPTMESLQAASAQLERTLSSTSSLLGKLEHGLGGDSAGAARPARGVALGASADRLSRAAPRGPDARQAAMSARRAALVLLLAGSGCLGSSPASRFYTLSTLPQPEGQGAGGAGPGLRVRVAPVTLPEGVDRPQLVRRTGENTVVVEEYDRWVEPLDALLRNTLVLDLGALVPSAQFLGDAVPGLAADRTVVVAVNRLDLSTQVVMDAVWFVLPAGTDQPQRTQRTRLTEGAGSGQPGELAQALSRVMERLSREIAAELGGAKLG